VVICLGVTRRQELLGPLDFFAISLQAMAMKDWDLPTDWYG
jgi:hypothetical protein